MSKKSKSKATGKSSRKSKKNAPLGPGDYMINNPNFTFGYNSFLMENEDCYIGEFCAHIKGIAFREGQGIYVTKDDHSYEGVWENDQLLNSENSIISYPDGTEYRGPIKNAKYEGIGTYKFPNKMILYSRFEKNEAVGDVFLEDEDKHVWRGRIENHVAILRPENHFYTNLNYKRGIGKKRSRVINFEKQSEPAKIKPTRPHTDWEKFIFKKSKKTKDVFSDTFVNYGEDYYFTTPVSSYDVPKKTSEPNQQCDILNKFMSKTYLHKYEAIPTYYPFNKMNDSLSDNTTAQVESLVTDEENSYEGLDSKTLSSVPCPDLTSETVGEEKSEDVNLLYYKTDYEEYDP